MEFISEKRGSNTFLTYEVGEMNLDRFACNMFAENVIPFMIPFSIMYKDGVSCLEYNVSGLRTIEMLTDSVITRNKLGSIISGFISAYISLEDFMLDLDNVVLDNEHVYYNKITEALSLIYLPVEKIEQEESNPLLYLAELLGKLKIDARDKQLENDVIQIIQEIRDEEIEDLPALQFVQKKLNLEKQEKSENTREIEESVPEKEETSNKPVQNLEVPVSESIQKQIPQNKIPVEVPEIGKGKTKNSKKLIKKNTVEKPAGKAPSTKKIGFSIPGQEENRAADNVIANEVPPVKEADSNKKKSSFKIPEFGLNRKSKQEPVQFAVENKKKELPQENFSKKVSYGAEIIPEQEEHTVLLGNAGEAGNVVRAHLERVKDGRKIEISNDHFLVGRGKTADFVIDDPKVSREHAQISVINGQYYVTDMRSSNHTYLNGKQIMPGENVRLKNGDQIRLYQEIFVFMEG